MMDGKTVRNMYSVTPKYNKFKTLVHLVGFTIEMLDSMYYKSVGKSLNNRNVILKCMEKYAQRSKTK